MRSTSIVRNGQIHRSPTFKIVSALATAVAMAAPLPAATFKLEDATTSDIQAAMNAGALSSVDLISLYLNRIAIYDRNGIRLNAIPTVSPTVFAEAAAADQARLAGDGADPLLGIPFVVKDLICVQGVPVTNGESAFANFVPNADAHVVASLKASGAVALGVSNMIIAGNGIFTAASETYGVTKSPYTLDSPSGSSSGSAAATAANLVTTSIGLENNGSIRYPSAVNGLVGIKPTRGLVSLTGALGGRVPDFAFIGPIARTVTDAATMLEAMTTPDSANELAFTLPATVLPARNYTASLVRGALQGKKLGLLRQFNPGGSSSTQTFDPEVTRAFQEARTKLESLGATVVEVTIPKTEVNVFFSTYTDPDLVALGMPADYQKVSVADNDYYISLAASWDDVITNFSDGMQFPDFSAVVENEFFFKNQGSGPILNLGFPSRTNYLQYLRDQGWVKPLGERPRVVAALAALKAFSDTYFTGAMDAQGLDALVYPTLGVSKFTYAPIPGTTYGNYVTFLNAPLVTVPMSFGRPAGSSEVLPQSLMFVGRPFDEAKLIGFAYNFEQATRYRETASLTPPLPGETIEYTTVTPPSTRPEFNPPALRISTGAKITGSGKKAALVLKGGAQDASGLSALTVYVNGKKIAAKKATNWKAIVKLATLKFFVKSSANSVQVTVLAKDVYGNTSVATKTVKLPKDA